MNTSQVIILSDPTAVAAEAAQRFADIVRAAVAARGECNVALAGGSTPAGLYRLLTRPPYRSEVDWSRVVLYFGDERCVPPEHTDSNYRLVRETLLVSELIPPANVFRMAGELSPAMAAREYADILRQNFGLHDTTWPHLDLVLLGMGDDGHTASLFPGMPVLAERRRPVADTDVPAYVRPAVPRLTLTLPVINAARHVMFLVTGVNKAPALRAVLTGPEPSDPLPARRVRPTRGILTWLLDEAAAAGLEDRRS